MSMRNSPSRIETQIQEIRRFAEKLTPESARRFLERAGIVTRKGKLTRNYR